MKSYDDSLINSLEGILNFFSGFITSTTILGSKSATSIFCHLNGDFLKTFVSKVENYFNKNNRAKKNQPDKTKSINTFFYADHSRLTSWWLLRRSI